MMIKKIEFVDFYISPDKLDKAIKIINPLPNMYNNPDVLFEIVSYTVIYLDGFL